MNFLPTDEFRRLCKDEKSFRELNEIVQSFVAVSGAGTGKEYWKAYLDHCSDLVLEIDGLGKIIAIHSIGKSTGEKQFIGRGLKMLLPSILAKKLPSAIENAFSSLRAEKMFLGNDNETPFLERPPIQCSRDLPVPRQRRLSFEAGAARYSRQAARGR